MPVEAVAQPADVILGYLQKYYPSACPRPILLQEVSKLSGYDEYLLSPVIEYLIRSHLIGTQPATRIDKWGDVYPDVAYALTFSLH